MSGCNNPSLLKIKVFETSESGNKLSRVNQFPNVETYAAVTILPNEKFQTITGFGGSFTEASAHLLNRLSSEKRKEILEAYFGPTGANYSLTRTHMGSCDFSLGNYSYAPVSDDADLLHFSVNEDLNDIIPMIKEAMAISADGFKLIASPWTAPPWMKDNNSWIGGKLLPKYYNAWALYYSKYISAYRNHGIDIWGLTVINEPLGNDNNWESMHFSPQEMVDFAINHLAPVLAASGHKTKVLGFDQNRGEELKKWVDAMYADEPSKNCFDGTAVHWYASTFDYFPESLQYAHQKAPGKHLIQTEACIDAEIPVWKNDSWYWSEEATDWGWDWAPGEQKHLHPKYVPVYRYARDIIGCLNNWVDGWIDWNMVLDKQGGPNWAKNWCVAPVIVDPQKDEVYFTPLFYTLAHFSKFIRPGATRIGFDNPDKELMVTAASNPDGSIAAILFNPTAEAKGIRLALNGKVTEFAIRGKALQTIVIPKIE